MNSLGQARILPACLIRWAFLAAVLFALTMACIPEPPRIPGDPPDTLLHLVAFVVLTGLASVAYPRTKPWQILIGLGVLGATIELVQSAPNLGRESSLADWGLDIAAILATLAIRSGVMLLVPAPNRCDLQ